MCLVYGRFSFLNYTVNLCAYVCVCVSWPPQTGWAGVWPRRSVRWRPPCGGECIPVCPYSWSPPPDSPADTPRPNGLQGAHQSAPIMDKNKKSAVRRGHFTETINRWETYKERHQVLRTSLQLVVRNGQKDITVILNSHPYIPFNTRLLTTCHYSFTVRGDIFGLVVLSDQKLK